MGYSHEDYFAECIEIAAEECGANLTQDQTRYIAEAIEGARDNLSMAFGYDVASANLAASRQREIDDANACAQRERNKVHCRTCDGSGRERYSAGPWAVDTECSKCRGEGRHDP